MKIIQPLVFYSNLFLVLNKMSCDYNTYISGGTASNNRYLPLYTKTLDECHTYLGHPPDTTEYSKLKNSPGYLCLPWCNTVQKVCSTDKINLSDDGEWKVNGKGTGYVNHISRYMPNTDYDNIANLCILLNDEKKTCKPLDKVCCGKGFGSVTGLYCDRLDENKLYLTTCHTEGSRSECCDHGVCNGGICICDTGYAGTCCNCAPGYHKDENGNCILDDIYCCDTNTFQVSSISPDQCVGPNKKIVPDNSANNCWPQGKKWCSNDKEQCIPINSAGDWEKYRDKSGILVDDCENCFPNGLVWCNSDKICPSSELQKSDMFSNGKSTWIIFIVGILIVCFIILILYIKKR